MNETNLYKAAWALVQAMDKTVDKSLPKEIAEIVKFHSKAAAVSGVAGGWIPGVGSILAVIAGGGFVWSMYVRINNKIELPFSENVIKTVASGIVTNLAAGVIGGLVMSTALSFLPGIGNVGASVVVGGICYAVTLTAGFVYLKTLTIIFKGKADPTTLTAEDLKGIAKSVVENEDIKSVMKEAKKEYVASEK